MKKMIAIMLFIVMAVSLAGCTDTDKIKDNIGVVGSESAADGSGENAAEGGSQEGSVEVPDFTGKTYYEAIDIAEGLGLTVSFGSEYSGTVKKDVVIAQDPVASAKITAGDVIKLTISLGEEADYVSVPDVIGQTAKDALIALEEAGLSADITYEYDGTETGGKVTTQSAAADSKLPENTTIGLTVGVKGNITLFSPSFNYFDSEQEPLYGSGTMRIGGMAYINIEELDQFIGTAKEYSYASSAPSVADIYIGREGCKIEAFSKGTAAITAWVTAENDDVYVGTFDITVLGPQTECAVDCPETIAIDPKKGETSGYYGTWTLKIVPAGAAFVISSSDESVVVIDKMESNRLADYTEVILTLIPVANGRATVTVSVEDYKRMYSKSFEVIVGEEDTVEPPSYKTVGSLSASAVTTKGRTPSKNYELPTKVISVGEFMYSAPESALLAETDDVSVYCLRKDDSKYWLLRWGEDYAEFDWPFGGPRDWDLKTAYRDIDGDSEKELAVVLYAYGGTGEYVEELHIVEKNADGTMTDHCLPEDLWRSSISENLKKYTSGGHVFVTFGSEYIDFTQLSNDSVDPEQINGFSNGYTAMFGIASDGSITYKGYIVPKGDKFIPVLYYGMDIDAVVAYKDGVFYLRDFKLVRS